MVINHLTAIGDVWMCVDRREYADAKRFGREFAEDLRLLENLGAILGQLAQPAENAPEVTS
jgi:hypothetical protein